MLLQQKSRSLAAQRRGASSSTGLRRPFVACNAVAAAKSVSGRMKELKEAGK
jgi:hypothetical protein